jgi:hypothetical protein
MKYLIPVAAVVCLAASSPALAQQHSVTHSTENADGSTTTTTQTVKKDPGGTAPGAATGAVAGAMVAGPIGAVVGGVAGAVAGHTVAPPTRVRTYVTTQTAPSVTYPGEIAMGRTLDGDIAWRSVPDEPKYSWAYINGQRVVIDNDSHQVVALY